MKSVFVTVGTTSFDDLIATVCSPAALQVLQSRGYQKLVLQVGRGALKPALHSSPAMAVEAFRFKDSLGEDLRRADLVISHAGAGSCLEALEKQKPLIVVTNEKLMNNHQLELAKQLHRDGHVLCCNCRAHVFRLKEEQCKPNKVVEFGKSGSILEAPNSFSLSLLFLTSCWILF
ncbi:UDP-N-acetylglucosamine transferase subunit ALG13-like isoform 1-T1 [Sarcoramphus papa]